MGNVSLESAMAASAVVLDVVLVEAAKVGRGEVDVEAGARVHAVCLCASGAGGAVIFPLGGMGPPRRSGEERSLWCWPG